MTVLIVISAAASRSAIWRNGIPAMAVTQFGLIQDPSRWRQAFEQMAFAGASVPRFDRKLSLYNVIDG